MSFTPPRASSVDSLASGDVPTTTSHVPGDHPESPTSPRVSERSALWMSLLRVVGYPNAASGALLETVAGENNPRPLRGVMQDSAEYWIRSNGEPFTLRFPAKIDRGGQFGKLGAYFNLPDTGLDINSLRKARAQFELKFLTEEDDNCPPDAILCSNTALEILMHLYQSVEEVRSVKDGNRKPRITPFHRSYDPGYGDYYSAVVLTDPLFRGLPNTERGVAPKLKRADIGKSGGCLSPSKARAAASRAQAALPTAINTQDSRTFPISHLPDPQNRYAGLSNVHPNLSSAYVLVPDVFDSQGVRISPADYEAKCGDGQFVEVEVIVKHWNILPSPSNSNGSRVYQLVAKQMKFLPYHTYTKEALLKAQNPVAKGKRKATSDCELMGQSPTKKVVMVETDGEMEL